MWEMDPETEQEIRRLSRESEELIRRSKKLTERRVLCSICFKPLDLSRCKIDEDGHPVHEQCYMERLHFLSQVKKPPTNERTGSALQGWRVLCILFRERRFCFAHYSASVMSTPR